MPHRFPWRLCLTSPHSAEWQAGPISYHKQQQHHYHPITDQEIKCRRVLKGIIWAILGFFLPPTPHYGEIEEDSSRACAVWLPPVADSGATLCLGGKKKERGGAGPKTDMLSSAQMPSNHRSSLPLFRAPPPPSLQRDPLCNPN